MPVVTIVVAALFFALAAAEPAVATSRYTVVPHDTLYSIASRFHVPLPLLEEVNGIHDPSQLRVGQVLIIPDAGSAMYARRQPAAVARSTSYIVRSGDTLYRLALTHRTTVPTVETMNGLASPAIRMGQVLRLPEAWAPPKVTARRPPAPGTVSARGGARYVPAPSAPPQASAAGPTPRSTVPPDSRTGPYAAAVPLHETPVPPATPSTGRVSAEVRETALEYVGVPYRWGGTTASGVDCSGLVYAVYSAYVANLPRTSYEQWSAGVAVHRADLEVGDLLFFDTDGSGASHVGIYIGSGRFVHSASSAQRVVIDRLDTPYYLTHYIGARRVL